MRNIVIENIIIIFLDITYHGISPLEKSKNNSNWSFGQSFLFTVTIVTTIGNIYKPGINKYQELVWATSRKS